MYLYAVRSRLVLWLLFHQPGITTVRQSHAVLPWLLPPHWPMTCLSVCVLLCVFVCKGGRGRLLPFASVSA